MRDIMKIVEARETNAKIQAMFDRAMRMVSKDHITHKQAQAAVERIRKYHADLGIESKSSYLENGGIDAPDRDTLLGVGAIAIAALLTIKSITSGEQAWPAGVTAVLLCVNGALRNLQRKMKSRSDAVQHADNIERDVHWLESFDDVADILEEGLLAKMAAKPDA